MMNIEHFNIYQLSFPLS